MSDYIRGLREKIGTTVLEIPTVSVIIFDDRQRVLLVRHSEGNDWTTPGGMVEPYELPSNAALRETWEETGLIVELSHIIGVFGGDVCVTTYSNGDTISWIATLFSGNPVGGILQPDGEETLEVRYFERTELNEVPCKPHIRLFLDAAYAPQPGAHFQKPTWQPPGVSRSDRR
jgi:ADP-ribose pyrophosphatase YjhB (NUDIX family)